MVVGQIPKRKSKKGEGGDHRKFGGATELNVRGKRTRIKYIEGKGFLFFWRRRREKAPKRFPWENSRLAFWPRNWPFYG